jgi:hypothetical protein
MARTRQQFQELADVRAAEAEVLLDAGMWDGAYYLAGYAVEQALKACILAGVDWEEVVFNEKKFVENCWSHNLAVLRGQAKLDDLWRADAPDGSQLAVNRGAVRVWSEERRYERVPQSDADALYAAITDPADGVLPWIKRYW